MGLQEKFMTLRVFMVEDSAALRAHLTDRLVTGADVAVVGIATTESQAKHWIESNPGQWDVAVVDLFLREGAGAGVVEHCCVKVRNLLAIGFYPTHDTHARSYGHFRRFA